MSRLSALFWSLYGKFTWDQHDQNAMPSEPPGYFLEILNSFRKSNNESVLDAGCGTGNYSLALAREGYHVTAIDYSNGMLDKVREKASDPL